MRPYRTPSQRLISDSRRGLGLAAALVSAVLGARPAAARVLEVSVPATLLERARLDASQAPAKAGALSCNLKNLPQGEGFDQK